MTGHIRRRGERSWELKFDAGTEERTGRRTTKYHTFRGTRRDAQLKLAELITANSRGSYVDKSKVTVAEHTAARIDQWEASKEISAKTAERYRELLTNQIAPHIGGKHIQKLKAIDIEGWHTTLRTNGRKDGTGGLSNRTIGHAHRVLSQALADGARYDLVTKNVAADQGTPKVDDDEMVIATDERVRDLVARLRGRVMYAASVTALFTGLRRGELLAARWALTDIDSAKVLQVREALEETKAHGIRFKKPKTKNGVRDVTPSRHCG